MNTHSPDGRDGYKFGRADAAAFPGEDALDAAFTPTGWIKVVIGAFYGPLYVGVVLGIAFILLYTLAAGEPPFS